MIEEKTIYHTIQHIRHTLFPQNSSQKPSCDLYAEGLALGGLG